MKELPFRLLTFNCHEAWVHQLQSLALDLYIVDGLPGRYCASWDERVRPLPRNCHILSLPEVLRKNPPFDCIVTHNLTDLLDSKSLWGPRILVIHSTLEGRRRQQGLRIAPDLLKNSLQKYLAWIGGHGAAVSRLKGESWGIVEDIVEFGVDIRQYRPWSGEMAAGLRVSNQILSRKEILLWDFHQSAFKDIPVRLVGYNPNMPGVNPSRSWEDLKEILSSHRFFIHTAHPELEDGYNMATLEAMAAGLPVLGNRHASSPVEHGVSGFLSDDPAELNRYARTLIQDRNLARKMGEAAKKTVGDRFSMERFALRFRGSIVRAWRKWGTRQAPDSFFTGGKEIRESFPSFGRLKTLRQAETFREQMAAREIEEAVGTLDDLLKILNQPRAREIGTMEDFFHLVIEIGERLRAADDPQSAFILSRAMLEFLDS